MVSILFVVNMVSALNFQGHGTILFVVGKVSIQYYISIYNWPSLTKFGVEVHLDNLQAKLDYCDLDLIFKVMEAILFVVDMVSAQYPEK